MESSTQIILLALFAFLALAVSATRDCSDILQSIQVRNVNKSDRKKLENSVKRLETLQDFETFIRQTRKKSEEQLPMNVSEIYPYDSVIQDLVNYQVNQEMNAFYQYTNMAMYFHRHDNDYPGFAKYFQAGADEELKHAQMFMKFQMKRGGSLELMKLDAPPQANWKNAVAVIDAALTLEKQVTTKILCLHDIGNSMDDKDFVDFLESNMIGEQYESMRELQGHKRTLERMAGNNSRNEGLAEFQFDQMLQKKQN